MEADYEFVLVNDGSWIRPQMYHAITLEGYECAAARRTTRDGEPPIRSCFARMLYKLLNKISSTEIIDVPVISV